VWAAEFNAALNDAPNIEVRTGWFFDPVRDETFDLITTNPPFVISPATGTRLVYRDSGLPGDEVVRLVVSNGPAQNKSQTLADTEAVRVARWRLAGEFAATRPGEE
jgi:methylase of polypeptide subunit release factors